MKKRFLWGIAVWLVMTTGTFSQSQSNPIYYRARNGEKGLSDFLMKNIQFPESSLRNNTFGYSISRILISPDGRIDSITIINPIDKYIDREVIRLLKLTSKLWLKCDTVNHSQPFYIQIVFSMKSMNQNLSLSNTVSNKLFIKPVLVTAFGFKNGSRETPETDEILWTKCSELVNSGKFNDALPYVNDLIKRNPFNKELYQMRMLINRKLNRNDLVGNDLQKINNFAEGLSLDKLLNN
jgi:hypothetical protein